VINLSSIVAGTGGFVIYGDYSKGYSGRWVSSAGDVNGVGLDDLIVGAASKYHIRSTYILYTIDIDSSSTDN
jgi:hypothetical protein